MKKVELSETRAFNPLGMKNFVLHESEFFKIINFNIAAGRIFPVHAHDLDGQVSIHVVEGTGAFLGDKEVAVPAKAGDILISNIREPHGVRADTDMRILVTIAPPI